MYPKNKPLPPEAAGSVSSLNAKKESEKVSHVSTVIGVSGSHSTSTRKEQSDENSIATSSPRRSPLSGVALRQIRRSSPTGGAMPPSYNESIKGNFLCEGSFVPEGVVTVGAATTSHEGGAVRTSNKIQGHLSASLRPPPYEVGPSSLSGVVDENSYDFNCGRGGPPPVPTGLMLPSQHAIIPLGMSTEAPYFDRRQMHGLTAPSMPLPPPPLPPPLSPQNQTPLPWPTQEMMNPPPTVPGAPAKGPPRYNNSNGRMMPRQAPYYYPLSSQNGIPCKSRWNSYPSYFLKEKDGGLRRAEDTQCERKSEKDDFTDRANDLLHNRQYSMESNFSAQGHDKHDQGYQRHDIRSPTWRENKNHTSAQHRQGVNLLVQVIVVLLERITAVKAALSNPKSISENAALDKPPINANTDEFQVPTELQQDEDALILKEQLIELQNAFGSLQEEGVTMNSNRRRLLDAIMAFPQLIPLSTVCSSSLEESISSSLDIKVLAEEKLISSRDVTAEVNALMKALDFETTRPITLKLVAPPYSSSSSSIYAVSPAKTAKKKFTLSTCK
ncbi:hypothetical protein TraAM80_00446 [Trypanosoma rangeli]|uniref:Uncharacterized protein n=1 Tax=Trypanosoma rangeli TaxID=5698 RepID=A0A3R7NUW0_TRYRA|nr:uncharacterized protein TraAM80_00446 [Trypanosoma rangeli]RNF12165.1 hypothetical protein TraAM80_00446 [Trypanosoma rangeli]|eukprot:RNF12165.1 hypothetical protein TraAM80_00446 [Trypanosoma rangeli]